MQYYKRAELEGALSAVGVLMSKVNDLKVIFHNGQACDADIHKKTIRVPRVFFASEAELYGGVEKSSTPADRVLSFEDAVMLLRSNFDHELGHIMKTRLGKNEWPKGSLHRCWNAVEDAWMEREMGKEAPGIEHALRWGNEYYNRRIAKQVTSGEAKAPLWESLCAMGLLSNGIAPAWNLTEKAEMYFEVGYDIFVRWRDCHSSSDTLAVAKELHDALREAHDEHEKNAQQEQGCDESQEKGEEESDESQDGQSGNPSESSEKKDEKQSKKGKQSSKSDKQDDKPKEKKSDKQDDKSEEKKSDKQDKDEKSEGDSADASEEDDDENGSSGGGEDDFEDDEESEDDQGASKGEDDSEDDDSGESEGASSGDEEDDAQSSAKGGDQDDGDQGDEENGAEGGNASSGGGGDFDDFDDEESDESSSEDEDGEEEGKKSKPQKPKGKFTPGDSPYDVDSQANEVDDAELEAAFEAESEGPERNEFIAEDLSTIFGSVNTSNLYTSRTDADEHLIPEKDGDKEVFKRRRERCGASVMALTRAMEQALRTITRCRKDGHRRRGKIDRRRLTAIAKSLSKEVFYQTREGFNIDTAVSIVIDESGSMGNYEQVKSLAIAMGEALSKIGVPFEITGTTTMYAGSTSPRLNGFSRTNPIIYKHYKLFDESWESVRHRTVNIQNHIHNVDGETVEFAASRLSQRKEARKVIFSICDGEPCAGHGNNHEMGINLRKVCEKVRKCGIEVYGFGVGTRGPQTFYGRDWFVFLENSEEMGPEFVRQFSDIITGGRVKVGR